MFPVKLLADWLQVMAAILDDMVHEFKRQYALGLQYR